MAAFDTVLTTLQTKSASGNGTAIFFSGNDMKNMEFALEQNYSLVMQRMAVSNFGLLTEPQVELNN